MNDHRFGYGEIKQDQNHEYGSTRHAKHTGNTGGNGRADYHYNVKRHIMVYRNESPALSIEYF